jgi:hypothetical protein
LIEQQKVHFIDGAGDGRYLQALLLVYDERMNAELRVGKNGRPVPPNPKVRILAGPVVVKRRIFQVAQLSGISN